MTTVLVIQNEASDPPGLVGQWIQESGIHLRILHAYSGDVVPRSVPADVHAIVVLGGSMGANDDAKHPWLTDVKALLADAVARDISVLGLCLGGQLLATALGGTVEGAQAIEIGVSDVVIRDDAKADAVLGAYAGTVVPAAQWHQDYISIPPTEAVVLADNANCPVQAFRFGRSAYGFQFHPEVDTEIFDSWFVAGDAVMSKASRAREDLVAQVDDALPELIQTWKPIITSWMTLINQ